MSAVAVCTVGVLFPTRFHASHDDFAASIERLRLEHPDVEVLVAPYEDSPERRTRRSRSDHIRPGDDDDVLSDHQREVYERMDVALALDLPYDIARISPRLRWVQAVGAGIGHLRSAGVPSPTVRLTTAAGTSAPEIAEFVIARILEHAKHLRALDQLQRDRSWSPRYGRAMSSLTVGLVGLGAINSEVARLADAFGMRVLGVARRGGAPPAHVDELVPVTDLALVVERCDVVVAALPETAATTRLFDERVFASSRAGSLFVNVGRGTAVDDDALLAALDRDAPAVAALDVFADEPLPPDHVYWRHGQVRVSAHCSSVPARSIERVHELFRSNLVRFMAGEPLVNEVTTEPDP